MVRRFAIALFVWLSAHSGPAWAALEGLVAHQDNGVLTAKLSFSESYTLLTPAVEGAVSEFVLRLQNQRPDTAVHDSKLEFDERDNGIQVLDLTAAGKSHSQLVVKLRKPYHVLVLPQYTDRQIVFKLIAPERYRKLNNNLVRDNSTSGPFVVTLTARTSTTPSLQEIPRTLVGDQLIYSVPFVQSGQTWQRLRVGFFDRMRQAEKARAQVLEYYPDAWISRVSAAEAVYAEAFQLNPEFALASRRGSKSQVASSPRVSVQALTPSTITSTEIKPAAAANLDWKNNKVDNDPLFEQANQAFRAKDYPQAIKLYTRVMETGAQAWADPAHERLGIAREHNGQIAQAIAVYRSYLDRYQNTPGAKRVRQRMEALVALSSPQPAALRRVNSRSSQWRVASNLSQFYRRYSWTVEGEHSVPVEGVFTDVVFNARKISASFDNEIRVSTSYLWDMADKLDNKDLQISRASWASYASDWRTGIKLGRQSDYDAGVLGRFDGIVINHNLSDALGFGAAAGYLVESSFDSLESKRSFQSVFANFTTLSGDLRINPFVMQQDYEGQLDRQALGFHAQYVRDKSLYLAILDYDFHHQVLNNASVMVNLGIGEVNSVRFSIDQRRSPYIATRNALIGQPYEDLNELEKVLVDLSLEDLAQDRTAVSRSFRLGYNRELSPRWAVSLDAMSAHIDGTDSSMSVNGFNARDDQYYSMQVRVADAWGLADYSALSLRRADSDFSTAHSVMWDVRFSVGDQWTVAPRIRVDLRDYQQSEQKHTTYRPSLRLRYRHSRWARFELDVGYEQGLREQNSGDIDMTGVSISFGYRASF